ncbi:hypothetical protein H9Y04_36375 [Streptomyces sp. TRM66268-LWL]|uniref:Uncharacterized protein n=1 Tax=Streptomyces polyasparticus TaxID=2767826 RepID=A0ABR7SRH3_9ACTN|nr:hypothetical protein [Streptomyces polyasparticus]MBC9718024.1 hypothetical protein [Streptomyces polyasparticus]
MTSLAERAHAAAVFINRTRAAHPHGPYRGEEHARTALRLAAALGLPIDQITTDMDWRRRRTQAGEPVLATATCPDTGQKYVFLARHPLYEDDAFELLGPCPQCAAPVPVAWVRHLGDLGDFLARPPLTDTDINRPGGVPETFADDSGHASACAYGDPC